MYPEDLLAFIPRNTDLGKAVAQLPKGVQMKYLVTTRVFAALMFDPSSALFKELMDRAEGKVPDKLQHDGTLNVQGLETILEKVYGKRDDNHSG